MSKKPSNPKSRRGAIKRTVDLGREEELVTWDGWFARSMEVMREAVPKLHHDRLAFRVALVDGRIFGVRQVMVHVARGSCSIGPSRWNEREAICDVITGYVLLGAAEDGAPSTLCVSPASISSVECILIPEIEDDTAATPFGFYKREGIDVPVKRKEVEEKFSFVSAEGSD